jgi:6,7-dimethyl-8-ribityllumazine synthase
MAWIHEGHLDGRKLGVAIVVGRFNGFITERLLEGALDCLERHGVDPEEIDVFRVPGAWEIPPVAGKLSLTGDYDAVICLGAVIRGDTPHFEYVAAESAKGIASVAMNSDIPVIYGIITADSVDQAIDRAGAKSGNKGFDAAMTALEMAGLYRFIDGEVEEEDTPEGGKPE